MFYIIVGDIEVCRNRCSSIVEAGKQLHMERWAAYSNSQKSGNANCQLVAGWASGVDQKLQGS